MTDALDQIDAFTTPGSLLKAARVSRGMSEREAADRLNLMPNYVGILERDDYQALRSPPFARGYVKAYGRLLGLDEKHLMAVFDQVADVAPVQYEVRVAKRPLQLQRTGLGVVIGLGVLLLLVLALWWWEEGANGQPAPALSTGAQDRLGDPQQYVGGGE
ncbi:MAG: helix-turn-helix domain-containing protein [Halioglobus sp.]|nr:helix-turn-helix domain-containing protein [Halioglobus sp.]